MSLFRQLRNIAPRSIPFSEIIAVLGLLVAAAGLFVSYKAIQKSDKIAAQALELSKSANEIALGTRREAGTLEFTAEDSESFQFDFTVPKNLRNEFVHVIRLSNGGRRPASGISASLIGIEPLTYALSDPSVSIHPLPSMEWKVELSSAVQPSGAVMLDVRKPLLIYLQKLSERLADKDALYKTSINIVISTRSAGDDSFIGAANSSQFKDRELVTLLFRPSVVKTEDAKAILRDGSEPHRVYTP